MQAQPQAPLHRVFSFGIASPPVANDGAAPPQGVRERAWTFFSETLPNGLGNLGACFPTAVAKGASNLATAYAGYRAADAAESLVRQWSRDDHHYPMVVASVVVFTGGSLIAYKAGEQIQLIREARAREAGAEVEDRTALLRATLFLLLALAPFANAIARSLSSEDPEEGLDWLLPVAVFYVANGVRDIGLELLPEPLALAHFAGPAALEPKLALMRRSNDMMRTSLVPNIASAAVNWHLVEPALGDTALSEAILRALFAVGNEASQAAAATLDGPQGRVWPQGKCAAPKLSPERVWEETAMRSALAVPATVLYALAKMLRSTGPSWAYWLVSTLANTASGVQEFRSVLVNQARVGQHWRIVDAQEAQPEQDDIDGAVAVHMAALKPLLDRIKHEEFKFPSPGAADRFRQDCVELTQSLRAAQVHIGIGRDG